VEDEEVYKFIIGCLEPNPANRPTAADLLASKFL
jgi:serine/threonine protein kinase